MNIHVCPLDAVDTLFAEHDPSHLISLLGPEYMIEERKGLEGGRHLRIAVNDITEARDGLVVADESHARQIVDFTRGWDGSRPMVVHCLAGISRSTAAAYITLCVQNEDVAEDTLARRLRAASPRAKPNRLLVMLADEVLHRGGRMVAAIDALPEAELAPVGSPFWIAAAQVP